jgi:carbon storage regulator
MLVLTRKAGERIVLPDLGITIEICEVQGARVKVGIDAPPKYKILRAEIANVPAPESRPARPGNGRTLDRSPLTTPLEQREIESLGFEFAGVKVSVSPAVNQSQRTETERRRQVEQLQRQIEARQNRQRSDPRRAG